MTTMALWLLTFALHASVLLLVAWATDSCVPSLRGAWRELIWRTALFGAILTATVVLFAPPLAAAAHWRWSARSIVLTLPVEAAASSTPNPGLRPLQGSLSTAGAGVNQRDAVARTSSTRSATERPGQSQIPGASTDNRAAPRPIDWIAWFIGVWLAGAILMLTRLAVGLVRLRRELAGAHAVTRADATAQIIELAAGAAIAAPRLLCLDSIPGPIAVSGGRIVLPAWAIETLDREQLRAMLAHELGHIVRADPRWKLLIACWRALLWLVPAAIIAQRRLDEVAELACDAFAAQHTGNGRSLAECLATCAERHVRGYALELAPAMAARQSSLLHRIERLLEGVSMDTRSSGLISRGVAALALGAAIFCLPVIGIDAARVNAATQTAATASKSSSGHSSVSISSDDDGVDKMTVSLSDDKHKFSARIIGKITFTEDDSDIASISNAGAATLEETIGGVTRRLDLADHGGKVERHYFVDRAERPIDDEGRRWMTAAVLQLVRSGIGAEARAKHLYEKGGAPRVLDEIAQIPTDYVRGIYLRALMGLAKLTPAEVDRSVKLAGDMSSDYERRQSLTAIFDKQALGAGEQVTFLHQALRFDSDYERAELLVGTLPKLADTNEVRQAWLDAGLQVKSDYERRRTLTAMLSRDGLDDAQLARVIDASSSMSSDYEHRELLVAAAKRLHDADAVAPAYARSAQKISSDYERREALLALIHAGKLGTGAATAVLDSAAQIHTSYECREVLVALARVMPADAGLLERYRQVAQHLSDYERGEAEKALVR